MALGTDELLLTCRKEYLGDWLNLIGHQKAALTILKDLHTPESMQETETLRVILIWYYRFDITVGFLSGNGIILERDWIAASHESSLKRKEQNPSSMTIKFEEYTNHHRLLAADIAILFAKRTKAKKGQVLQSEQEFWTECNTLAQRIKHFEEPWDQVWKKAKKDGMDDSGWCPRPQDDIVDPTNRRPFFTGDLYTMNFVFMDIWALKVMFKYKLAQLEGKPPPLECREEAFKAAQMFEAVELDPDSRPGALLAMLQAFAMTCLFLPKDERTTTWVRRKFVAVEAKGYVMTIMVKCHTWCLHSFGCCQTLASVCLDSMLITS